MAAVNIRYARAFADVVADLKLSGATVLQEVNSLESVLSSSVELQRVWENPAITAEQKRRILDALAARLGLSKPVRNFAAVLIDHRRIGQLKDIARQFERELNQRMGLQEAEVTSARDLGEDERRALEQQIERLTGKKVRARYGVDRALLGGAVVKLGSTVYDGSVRGQLHKMKEALSSEL